MTIYALGDIQGCFDALERLLDKIHFDPRVDKLWFAGDLVNRGPKSLDTLRFVKSLGKSAITVLGNHDIHLLALYYGVRPPGKDPTLTQVLDAPDVSELVHWLQQQPLLHIHNHFALVHAGIHPHWTIDTALSLARELQEQLSALTRKEDLKNLYGPTSGDWQSEQHSDTRLRYALNIFTRMRFCSPGAIADFKHSCPPGEQPEHLVPWFDVSNRVNTDTTILFGHWAALGFKQQPGICALDSACVWGQSLTAVDLSDMSVHQVSCDDNANDQ